MSDLISIKYALYYKFIIINIIVYLFKKKSVLWQKKYAYLSRKFA